MKSFKKFMRSIAKFFSQKNIKRQITRAARVAEKITSGQVSVTNDNEVVLDESTTRLVVRKIASVAVGVFGFMLIVFPTNLRFTMDIGDRLIRMATTMWDGEQWTKTVLT